MSCELEARVARGRRTVEATEPVPGVAIAKQELDEAVRLGLPQATIAARRERHEHLTRAREQFLAKAKGELSARGERCAAALAHYGSCDLTFFSYRDIVVISATCDLSCEVVSYGQGDKGQER